MQRTRIRRIAFFSLLACLAVAAKAQSTDVDATSLRGKVMCGYQGWFRCPGDAADLGWVHRSRDQRRIAPETLSFEMWPDMTDYSPKERFLAAVSPIRTAAKRSCSVPTTERPCSATLPGCGTTAWTGLGFERFVVGMPGGPASKYYPSTMRVMRHVAEAAEKTGRVWAISYDTAAMPLERIFDALTSDWKEMVKNGIVASPRYLHQNGRPVVQIWDSIGTMTTT